MINNGNLKKKILKELLCFDTDKCNAQLGDIATLKSGKTPKNYELSNDGDVPYYKVSDMNVIGNEEYMNVDSQFLISGNYKLFPSYSIIFPKNGGALLTNKKRILTKDSLVDLNTGVLIPNEKIYYKYLFYLVVYLDFNNCYKGTALPTLDNQTFLETLVYVPPIEEQHKIVKKIEELFCLIDRKEKNDQDKEKLKSILKEKILDSAIRGELLKNNEEIAKYEAPLFDIPSSWKWFTFNDIAIIVRGGSPRPIKDYLTESENGINWIKIGDTNPNEYYINSVKEKIKPEGMKKSRFVEKGSLLLTNSMSFGRPYILNVDGCIHDGWLNIKDKNDNFYNLYMVYLLSSKYFYNIMCDKSSGAVVSNLNIDKVKSMMVPIPPLEEQKKIVEKIEKCFELIEQL